VTPVQNKQILGVLAIVFVVVPVVYVADQAVRTLRALSIIERERDTWQRPDDILRHLNLADGNTVVDLGSGAGYFALKIAPRVGPNGRVVAIDLRRQSLAFLWIRALAGGHANLRVTLSQAADPKLPAGPVDAVLIANTYHELTAPEPVLTALFKSMRSGARLVVVDRGPRDESRTATAAHHEMTAARAERQIHQQGFQTITRDDRFIDRPRDEDIWWLIVFRKP
jgi:ubiquinone/menaquinone biosynthesis C-methylase UbiE